MALKSTILKATIHLSDMDKNYYDTLNLTLAQHPSENEQRLMVRLIAFVLNAHEDLKFGKGLSDEEEAAIWQIDYAEQIALWVELGQIDPKRLKKASHRADQVKLYCYGSSTDVWWQQNQKEISNYNNVSVEQFPVEQVQALAELANKSMEFQISIQDGQLWLSAGEETLLIDLIKLK